MQQSDETTPVDPTPTPLDEAEKRSEKAWDKAADAVEDLKNLGHENEVVPSPSAGGSQNFNEVGIENP